MSSFIICKAARLPRFWITVVRPTIRTDFRTLSRDPPAFDAYQLSMLKSFALVAVSAGRYRDGGAVLHRDASEGGPTCGMPSIRAALTLRVAVVTLMNPQNVDTVFIAGKVKKWRGGLIGVDVADSR